MYGGGVGRRELRHHRLHLTKHVINGRVFARRGGGGGGGGKSQTGRRWRIENERYDQNVAWDDREGVHSERVGAI